MNRRTFLSLPGVSLAAQQASPGAEQKTILILDRESVSSSEGVTFHISPATKHPENPILIPGEPHEWDSLQVTWPGTVLYNAEERMFRCWYNGMDAVQKNRTKNWLPGYAESSDGVHWTKRNRILPDWPSADLLAS